MAFLQLLLFFTVLFLSLRTRQLTIFHPASYYLLFHFLVFTLRPLLIVDADINPNFLYMRRVPDSTSFVLTYLVSSFALILFTVSSIYFGYTPARKRTFVKLSVSKIDKKAFFYTALIVVPVILYSLSTTLGNSLLVSSSASISSKIQLVLDQQTGRLIFQNSSAYIIQAQFMATSLCLIFILVFRFSLWSFIPLLSYLLIRLDWGGGRLTFVFAVMSLVLLLSFRGKGVFLKARYLLAAAVLLIVFSMVGTDREIFSKILMGDSINWAIFLTNNSLINSPDFANFEFLAFILDVVPEKSEGYNFFAQYLELIFKPIPRYFWAEKPIGSPIQLVNLNDHGNFFGRTMSLVGDGWVSLGWVGVAITFTAVGTICGKMHKTFWKLAHRHPAYILIYLIFIPLTLQWFRDGGVSIFVFLAINLTPLLIWIMICRLLRGRRSVSLVRGSTNL